MAALTELLKSTTNRANTTLSQYSPLTLVCGAAVATGAAFKLYRWINSSPKPLAERVGDIALGIPQVNAEYQAELYKMLAKFQQETSAKWEQFKPLIIELPDQGMPEQEMVALIDGWAAKTSAPIADKHFSGMIYSPSLLSVPAAPQSGQAVPISSDETLAQMAERVTRVNTHAYAKADKWNALHEEFAIGDCVDHQVVQMVGKMFGGTRERMMGFVTSGGTESIMDVARAYRNWGESKGHGVGESVIIAPDSIHASLMKAAEAYKFKLVLIPTNDAGEVDMDQLKAAVKKHGSKVVALMGSAPSYAKGRVDPIRQMAKIAKESGCGMHVDCCLGGGVINYLDQIETDFLAMEGVTSLSADPHKNFLAPKGSSVTVTQDLSDGQTLAFHTAFAVPNWTGGIYGTPRCPGSKSCLPGLTAYITMRSIGSAKYREIAKKIQERTRALASIIGEFNGKLKLCGTAEVNVVAFRVDPALGLGVGASYALADQMKKKFTLSTLRGDAVHFCVTARFVNDEQALNNFRTALKASLQALEDAKRANTAIAGAQKLYCTTQAYAEPCLEEQGFTKYLINRLLGQKALRGAVIMHFMAGMNPWYKPPAHLTAVEEVT